MNYDPRRLEKDKIKSSDCAEVITSETYPKKQLNIPLITIIIITIVYVIFWFYIGVLKILSLNAYVFDLGLNSERGWQVLHLTLGLGGLYYTLINSGIVIPLSPLTSSGNFFAMIFVQVFMISIGGPAIYLISRIKKLGTSESTLLTVSYFLYFPLYGVLWFDFHYQSFFVPLFLYAYLFHLRKNYTTSTVLFIMSGLVRYPYSVFPLAFSLIELLVILRVKNRKVEIKNLTSLWIIFIVMSVWTFFGFLLLGISGPIGVTQVPTYHTGSESIYFRMFTIVLLMGSLLFLPILSFKWIIFTIPAFILILFSNNSGYLFPTIFQGQYISGIAPFLFLGTIDTLVKLNKKAKFIDKIHFLNIFRRTNHIISTSMVILIVLLMMNIVFAPFGPLNSHSNDSFNFYQNIDYKSSQYDELTNMINLIPQEHSYVAFQNNIPEILPLKEPYNGTLLMGGYLGSFREISLNEAINNSWSIYGDGKFTTVPIYYAIADASNNNFYLQNNSMYQITQAMFNSGKYSVLSEGDGLILLEWGYHGNIKYYIPLKYNLSFSSPLHLQNSPKVSGFSSAYYNQINISSYEGEKLFLFPGAYNLTLFLNSNTNSSLNLSSRLLKISSGGNTISLVNQSLTKSMGASGQSQIICHSTLYVRQIYGNVHVDFTVYGQKNQSVSGTLSIIQQMPYQSLLTST